MDRGVMRPTNVVKIARFVMPQAPDGTEQILYYDRGVGTGDFIDRIFGGAFGIGLRHNVIEAYEFLSCNYEQGDEIWLFGFSRGAYTVRRVVGMIRKCGLLPKDLDGEARAAGARKAYGIFLRREARKKGGADSNAARGFRETNGSPRVSIHFVGVWDAVGAYGIAGALGQLTTRFSRARFHDRRLSSDVRFACQALAIDEQRRLFQPAIWEQTPEGAKKGQVIEQRWFAGVHSNVGGGYEDRGLSDIALHWMAARAGSRGLCLDPRWKSRIVPDEFGELRDSRVGIYRFLPGSVRKIGRQPNGFEALHRSAYDRMRRDPARYEPENLLDYVNSPDFSLDRSEP